MKQRGNILLIVLIVVGILALVVFLFFKGNSAPTRDVSSGQKNDGSMAKNGADSMVDKRYVEYSEGVLEEHSGSRRVLYFYANWCSTCVPADRNFRENESRIPEDVFVVRVNYKDSDTDANEEQLADQYGITYQHTFVEIDSEGNEVQKWNGGAVEELLSRLQ